MLKQLYLESHKPYVDEYNHRDIKQYISLLPHIFVLQNQTLCYLDILRGRKHHLYTGNRRRKVDLEIGNCHSIFLYMTVGVQYQRNRLVVHTYVYIFHCMGSYVHPIFCPHCKNLKL